MAKPEMIQAYELYFGLPWGESDVEQAHWEACWKASREAGMAQRDRLQGELEALRSKYKNLHRSLCSRFDYVHDEKYWWRDEVSLEEWIAKGRDQLKAEVEELRNALLSAAEEVESWGGYASEYFQQKHDLPGSVARIRSAAAIKKASQ